MFTLEWDDDDLELSDNRKTGKSHNEKVNAHRIQETHHNRNGRLIRPLMQSLPYSLVKQKSSPPNSNSHNYINHKTHESLLNQGLASENTGRDYCL